METTKKVIENTAYKLTIETDDGAYRLTFTRRYDTETTSTGKTRYVYRGWNVKAYRIAWGNWKGCDASHIPASYKDKKTILQFIAKRPAFSQATTEIKH